MHSQGSESKNGWCLVVVPSSALTPEVARSASGVCSWAPSGGRPHPLMDSKMAAVLCPQHMRAHGCTEKDIPMAICPSSSLPPQQSCLTSPWSQPPPVLSWLWVALCSPACRSPLPSPLGYLHIANTSPFPGTDLYSLSLSTSPHPSVSCCDVCGSGTDDLYGSLSDLFSSVWQLCFSPRF